MGRLFVSELEGRVYSCKHCRTHLAHSRYIMSKTFRCRHGRAYLFDNVRNITVGEAEDRMTLKGLHTLADIFCVVCGATLGWKYERAYENSHKYKEGKYVLEMLMVLDPVGRRHIPHVDPAFVATDGYVP